MPRFSSTTLLHVGFFFAFLAGLSGLLHHAYSDLTHPQSLSIPVQALQVRTYAPDLAKHLKGGAAVGGADTIYVYVDKPTDKQRALDALRRYPLEAGSVLVFLLLWRLVAKARYTDPFTSGSVRRMRILAGVVLVGGFIAEYVSGQAQDALVRTMADNDVWAADSLLTISWLLPGLALLAAAEVLHHGQRMRAELAEVI
jgi:hypothetical protein